MKWFLKDKATFSQPKGETIISLGKKATDLLNNAAFQAAFEQIEADIFNAWKTSSPNELEARERLYYRLEGLAHIKLKLQAMMNNAILEAKNLEKEQNNG